MPFELSQRNAAYLMLFIATLTWGGAFVAAKYVVPEIHPLVAASIRFLISFLVLLPVLLIREGGRSRPAPGDLPLLVLLGLTGVFAYNALFFYGIGSTAAADGALIVASSPIWTALLSVFFLRERFSPRQLLGFLLSILGVLTIVTKGNPAALLTWEVNAADFLFFGCAFLWACYSVAGKRAMARLTPLACTTYAIGFGALFLTVAALPHYSLPAVVGLNAAAFWSLLFLGVVASGISFVFWFAGVHRVGAGRSGVFVNFAPLWAAFLAVLFLGEKLALFHLVGGLLTFGGVYLVSRKSPAAAPRAGRVPEPVPTSFPGPDKRV